MLAVPRRDEGVGWAETFVPAGLALAAALIVPAASGTPERLRISATFCASATLYALALYTFLVMGRSRSKQTRWLRLWTFALATLLIHLALSRTAVRPLEAAGWASTLLAAWWAADVALGWLGKFDETPVVLQRAALHAALGAYFTIGLGQDRSGLLLPGYLAWAAPLAAVAGMWRFAAAGPAPRHDAPPIPPGEYGAPLVGEALPFISDNHGFFTARVAKFGRVFRTSLFGDPVAVFSGPEAFPRLATDPDARREGANPLQVRELLLHDCLPLIDPPEHTRRKRLVLQALTGPALAEYVPLIESTSREHLEAWAALGTFAWTPRYKTMAAALVSRLFLGEDAGDGVGELEATIDRFVAGFTAVPFNLPWTTYGKALAARDELAARIRAAIARHKAGGVPASDVMSALLAARGPDGSGLDDGQLEREMLHLFFAAYGGIYVTLTYLSMSLGQHAAMKDRAREEVARVSPAGPIAPSSLTGLTYLGRVSLELRRFFPINAVTFFTRLGRPIRAEGVEAPGGWLAVGAIHTTLVDPEAFPEPERFDPDRFETVAPSCPFYVPHGGGPPEGHRCPGEEFITTLVKVYGSVLLRSYDWTLLPQDLGLTKALFPLPRSGLVVKLVRRGG